MSSILGMMFGGESTRDNDQAQAYTDTYQNQLTKNTGNYDQSMANSLAGFQNSALINSGTSNQLAATNYMGGAQQAYQNQLANYGQQQQASQMLYNQATGQAPSAADIQMQAGLGNANNQVQSAALSQQGGIAPGLSQRNMLGAQAVQNANIVSQGAAMRAQELQAAQGMYANQLSNMGQTAAGMTNQQQSLGAFAYNQGQTNLGYQTQLNNQMYGNAAQNASLRQQAAANNLSNAYNAQMGNVTQTTAANAAQAQALGHTVSGAASFLAGVG